ncbi:MAG: hypothetical protein QF868_04410 [Candidatus Marinimicrobia bacterium]|jgi:hypothetical protein|uniref:Uncharacterized protein n=1 Tax=marine metagenome TaxID=408172 RepID=A0A381PHV2_9ZZZZ|nr:hypothetical protein [Candidatus Neomarinimicrobiota bacterium]MDP6400787.1 hypothetical protein [Candidatus Neomarinimicrobiota bacterium]MDP6613574.1 hypothetical protein [Candidatus Neomarinimicrobiota bacterium]MDP6861594.1 hypothetical protein [Candidatus Neomarinimicrobiota bacterium]MDP7273238.1 hypothetical protein [Candidatus Neomarinimicrobiota bacterium]|tara:strand:- start:2228 stop:2506 length:279 start_codon:yes stop_codon:yes gene_type:complete
MGIKTIPFRDVEEHADNMYEAVAAMFSQARRELGERVLEATLQEVESDDYGVFDEVEESTPEEYVEKEKVTTVAINKFLDGDVTWRKTDELG